MNYEVHLASPLSSTPPLPLPFLKITLRDTLRLLGAIETHRNRAVYVSLNTIANPTPNPNPNPNPNPDPNPNHNLK